MANLVTRLRVAVLALLSLVLFLGLLAYLADWLPDRGHSVHVRFSQAGPLHGGARVRLAGQTIGRVRTVRLLTAEERASAQGHLLQVELRILPEFAHLVTERSRFLVTTRGVLGEHYVEVVPGPPGADLLQADSVVSGEDLPRTDLVLAQVQRLVNQVIEVFESDPDSARSLLRNTASLIGRMDTWFDRNGGEMDRLVRGLSDASEGLAAGVGDGQAMANAVRQLTRASEILSRDLPPATDGIVRAADGLAGTLTTVQSAATGIEGAVVEVSTAAGDIQRFLGKDGDASRALEAIVEVVPTVTRVVNDLGVVVASLKNGEGLAGALLKDPEPLEDFKELLHELRAQPWKLVWKR
ncbi:MAG: hypothetical protein CMH55_04810 [Myxococcales bacterium]|nr:hypothetical protein [Myxococcales bacterium]